MTYADRYGAPDPTASGQIARLLADPSKFKRFVDGGAYWILAPDSDGNAWFVLVKGPNGEAYDFPQIAKRNLAGTAGMLAIFKRLESALAASLGIDVDSSLVLAIAPPRSAPARAPRYPGEQVPTVVLDAGGDLHVYRVPAILDGYTPQVAVNAWNDGTTITDLGTIDGPAAARVSRVGLGFDLNTKAGRVRFSAVGNPQLRIAYISGFPGEVIGGADWLAEALRTLVDVIVIVLAAWSGQVGVVIGEIVDIARTWYGYEEAHAAAEAAANGKGGALTGGGKQIGIPFITSRGGGGARRGRRGGGGGGPPPPLPPPGDLANGAQQAQAQQAQLAIVIVIVIAALLL